MSISRKALTRLVVTALTLSVGTTAGCLFAAAGAGAGGGIYYQGRGVESLVTSPVDRTYSAAEQAFAQLGIQRTKTSVEQEGATDRREINGAGADREVTVTLRTESGGTRIQVVARKSAVTWDKDFARTVLARIVALSG
jgi:uncharacterized protein DUF3568